MKPRHLAFICKGSVEWALNKRKKPYEGYRKAFDKILEIVEYQIKKNLPITTFYLMPSIVDEPHDYTMLIDEISAFLDELNKNDKVHKNKIKISIIGKWYNLPSRLIESVKKIIDSTKDYDSYFVNFCINYDGQDEIVDACKMVARRVKLNKIEVDSITKDTIKDDLYSSYFMPPDFVFVTGDKKSTSGFLLWDSINSDVVFMKKKFPDVTVKDIERGMKY